MKLSNFYKKAKEPVSSDEQAYFYPLQTSLVNPEQRYSDLTPIAEGGMKTVYQAQDLMSGRPVALAVLKCFDEPDQVESFFLEARLGALLQHPNIMPVYDLGYLPDGRPFFAMRLVSGRGVDRIIWSLSSNDGGFEGFDLAARLNLFLKVCDAISYAHHKGVLHLDIKPDNIQTGFYGEVLVCDWGVARLTADPDPDSDDWGGKMCFARGVTLHGVVKGTPGFMAPEQIDASIGPKDSRTDIYALGALLYSLLYLRLPFTKLSAREIIESRPSIEDLDFSNDQHRVIPNGLIAVIKRAMQTVPDDRYSSVLKLTEEITAFLTGYPTAAEEAGFGRQLQLLYHRNKRVSKLFGIGILVLTIVSTFFVIRLRVDELKALNALNLYEKGVKEKKAALTLYQTERQQANKLHDKYLEALGSQRRSAMELIRLAEHSYKGYSNYDDAIKYANLVLELKPEEMPKAYRIKGLCYFVQQRFHEALSCFAKSGGYADSFLINLAEEYAENKTDTQLLSTDKIYSLFVRLSQVRGYKGLIVKLYDSIDNSNIEMKLTLAEIVLRKLNQKQEDLRYSWYKSKGHFYVSVADNIEVRNLSCFIGLKLYSLNAANTSINFMKDISKSLVELNISNTRISFLEFIKFMPKLRKLTLTKKNFSETQLGFIRKNMKITDH